MFQLIKLEYKSFFRSSTLGGKIAAKIFMWLGYIYILEISTLVFFERAERP